MSQKMQSKSSFKMSQIQNYIMEKSYKLAYSSTMSIPLATFLFALKQLQIMSLLSIPNDSPLQQTIPNLRQFFTVIKIFSFQFPQSSLPIQNLSTYIHLCLCLISIIVLVLSLIPCNNKQIACILSKIITIDNILMPIPVASFLFQCAVQFQNSFQNYINLGIALLSFVIMLINYFIFANFHFAFSIKDIFKNVLVRLPDGWVKQFGHIFLAAVHQIVLKYGYPVSFIVYLVLYLGFSCFRAKKLTIQFQYFDAKLSRNLGMMNLLDLTLTLALFFCYFQVSLFQNSLTSFVVFFYLFFVNFFLTFRKFWIKRIIIDDNTPTQISQITHTVTFIIFSIDQSQKKNQTYISSLLKNHCNNCKETECCCKNRNRLYDPSKRSNGCTKLQPHLDPVFVKHYFLKMIEEGILQFPSSLNLKLMLALFYLQFLQLSTSCVKQIKYLNKKTITEKLSLQQKFVLFCLQQQFCKFVHEKNRAANDKKIENAKIFDEYFNHIVIKIMSVAQNLKYFWHSVNQNAQQESMKQLNPQFLSLISTKNLALTQQIQSVYEKMKNINPKSQKLKQHMFFYSKEVVNDMDLFIRLKEQLKMESLVYKDTADFLSKSINIFSIHTANLLVNSSNCIKWASNNAKQIFGFYKIALLEKSSINTLMPDFFAKKHDAHVKNWLQTGICSKINKTNIIWCQKQNGSCFKAAIYMKFMPNFNIFGEKDIQYYVSIQAIGNGQIICGNQGQIYGCDQNFKNLIRCSLKSIQMLRPNIQVFFPYLFQHFQHQLIHKSSQNKRRTQQRCSGYIPEKIAQYMQNFKKEKQNFVSKNKSNPKFADLYNMFLQIKMQEITTQIKGKYFTVDFQISRMNMLGRCLIVLKIIKIEKDTIQRYFNQLQKTIKRMLNDKQKAIKIRQGTVNFTKAEKNNNMQWNPIQFCLNLKRVKKVEQKIQQTIKGQINLANRRQRAINQLQQIKSQKVRQNLYKLKKAMYANKMISANTLRILTEQKQTDMYIIQQQEQQLYENLKQHSATLLQTKRKKQNNFDEQKMSSSSLLDENQQVLQICGDKDQQGMSFQQSTTSSAAFISISTKIKLLKQKLREIRPKPCLLILNSLFILLITSAILLNIWQINKQINISNNQYYYQQSHKLSCYRILQSLMSQKIIINNRLMNTLSNVSVDNQILDKFANIFQTLSFNQLDSVTYIGYKLQLLGIQPNYLQTFVNNTDTKFGQHVISMWDFFTKQYNQYLKQISSLSYDQFYQIIQIIKQVSQQQHKKSYEHSSLLYMIIFFAMIQVCTFINLNNYYKKIFSITKLISQLYPTDRSKYMRLFNKVCKKLSTMLQSTNINELNKGRNKLSHLSEQEKIAKQQNKHKNKNRYPAICMQVWAVFLLLYAAIAISYAIQFVIFQQIMEQNYRFDNIMVQRLQLTYKMLATQSLYTQWQMNQTIFISNKSIVEEQKNLSAMLISLYNSANIEKLSPNLKQTILQFSTNNTCLFLQPDYSWTSNNYNLNTSNDNKVFSGISKICQSVNNGTFKNGILNSYAYIDQSLSYYLKVPPSTWPASNITQIIHISLMNSLLSMKLVHQFILTKQEQNKYQQKVKLIAFGCFAFVLVIVLIIWRFLFLQLARLSSKHNCYLLMMPFDLLIQNPYLRQYLKQQFQFKSNFY